MVQNTTLVTAPTLSLDEVKKLAAFTEPLCVSIYFPTDTLNPDPRTNSIVFKNLINKALASFEEVERRNEIYGFLKETSDSLLDDQAFWKEQAGSLAVLFNGKSVATYKLATAHPELMMINDHYYVLPFISQLSDQHTFYLLELDKEHTQMWKGSENSLVRVDVPDLPRSVTEVTGWEVNERQLQFHTSTDSPGSGGRPAVYHGSSSWKDDHDRYLARFLQAVDKAVTQFFKQHQFPLLLSGVEEATVLFRQTTHYADLLEPNLPKISDPTHKEKTLHQQSWEIMLKHIEKSRYSVLNSFEETLPNKKTALLPEILREIGKGRVGTLLVAKNARVWGMFDSETLEVVVENTQKPLSAELLNAAARLTLNQSGDVIVLPDNLMPGGAVAAALFRF